MRFSCFFIEFENIYASVIDFTACLMKDFE